MSPATRHDDKVGHLIVRDHKSPSVHALQRSALQDRKGCIRDTSFAKGTIEQGSDTKEGAFDETDKACHTHGTLSRKPLRDTSGTGHASAARNESGFNARGRKVAFPARDISSPCRLAAAPTTFTCILRLRHYSR